MHTYSWYWAREQAIHTASEDVVVSAGASDAAASVTRT
jgi:hypothetical protein